MNTDEIAEVVERAADLIERGGLVHGSFTDPTTGVGCCTVGGLCLALGDEVVTRTVRTMDDVFSHTVYAIEGDNVRGWCKASGDIDVIVSELEDWLDTDINGLTQWSDDRPQAAVVTALREFAAEKRQKAAA